jgi:hypothetical protein
MYNLFFIIIETHCTKTFTDRSTHLGNLFVAVGKADLSNKMSIVYDGSEVFATKTFHSSVAVERKHAGEFAMRVVSRRHSTGLLNSRKKREVR